MKITLSLPQRGYPDPLKEKLMRGLRDPRSGAKQSRFRDCFGLVLICCLAMTVFGSPVEASTNKYEQVIDQLSRTMADFFKEQTERGAAYYDVVFRRDPMRPLVDSQGRLINAEGLSNELAVQGILQSNELALVLINDEFYTQGAQVGPYKIREIQSNGLVVERDQEVKFIPLYPEAGKKE